MRSSGGMTKGRQSLTDAVSERVVGPSLRQPPAASLSFLSSRHHYCARTTRSLMRYCSHGSLKDLAGVLV